MAEIIGNPGSDTRNHATTSRAVCKRKKVKNLRKESVSGIFSTVISNRRTKQTHFRSMLNRICSCRRRVAIKQIGITRIELGLV